STAILFSILFFSSRRRHTSFSRDWSSDVCSSDLSNRGTLLADGDVDAANLLVGVARLPVGLLVDDRVDRDGCLTGLAVTDDELRSEERRVGKEGRAWWPWPHSSTASGGPTCRTSG